ncbi:DNA cytosine methyltransferase [Streptomyces sp. N35]|uniref:DNA cytosine methyltransferase n=1 Tax=Streptomyces sp. N35 TaxID=2795730 RepID=UPI0035ABD3FE
MPCGEVAIGSLFSGVGGLDLGVRSVLGGRVAWHCENDSRAVRVLSRHWPDTPNLGDVREVDFRRVEPVDVLTAGFPCQDLSLAGPRTGLVGPRSGLWQHTVEAVRVMRPSLVVMENVPGLLSVRAGAAGTLGSRPHAGDSGRSGAVRALESCPRCLGDRASSTGVRALGVVLSELAACGYDTAWCRVRASDVGAPHRRARIFLAASPARQCPEEPAVEATYGTFGERQQPSTPGKAQGGRGRSDSSSRGRAPAAHPQGQRRGEGVPESEARRWEPHACLHGGPARKRCGLQRSPRQGCRIAAAHPDLGGRPRRSGHHTETQGRHQPAHSDHSPAGWWGEYLPAIRRWEHVTHRAAPAPTVPGSSRLSAEFVEWMMGFETGWVTGAVDLPRAGHLHLLGNSVVPLQAAHAVDFLVGCATPKEARCERLR